MKILYFVASYQNFTGSQRSLALLASRLVPNIERAALFTGDGKAVEGFCRFGVRTAVLKAPDSLNVFEKKLLHASKAKQAILFLRDLVPYTFRLLHYIRCEGADIIHCSDARSVLLIGWAAKLAGRPIIWHQNGLNGLVEFPLLNALTCRLSTVVVLVADALRDSVCGRVPCRTIYNAVDPSMCQARDDIEQSMATSLRERGLESNETVRLVTTSSLVPYKGHHHLLEAVNRLKMDCPDLANRLAWFVLGDIKTKENRKYQLFLHQRSLQLGLSRNIYWLGWQDNAYAWLMGADIVILPTVQHEIFSYPDGEQAHLSCTEGFPLTILEAMAAGKPVVASDVAGVREAVVDGKTGFVVSPGDPKAIQESLNVLINNRELRIHMGQQSRQRVTFFSVERAVTKTIKLYDDVLRGRLKGTHCQGS